VRKQTYCKYGRKG